MTPERRKRIHEAMVRFANGDRSAIDVLVAELWPVLLDFARRGLASDPDAEDVAQEVFVRICSRIAEFERDRDGLSWAFGIASYEVMTQRRRQRRRREVTDGPLGSVADQGASAEDSLIGHELRDALARSMGELTAEDRLVLGVEAAGSIDAGVPGATLRKRRQRALERLRSVWRGLYGRP
jgi:RNA polymerase sigma-70 factor (ECF subfamily)